MPADVAAIVCLILLMVAGAYGVGWWFSPRAGHAREDWAIALRKRLHRERLQPAVRPIEVLGSEVRRLGYRFHTMAPNASFAKQEAVRTAYDHVLAECCTSLEREHLLDVIGPGPELDAERRRVELVLMGLGVPLADVA